MSAALAEEAWQGWQIGKPETMITPEAEARFKEGFHCATAIKGTRTMIYWEVEENEADFILGMLNGQPTQPWTVMARFQLIDKLTKQAQPKTPPPKQLVSGEVIGGPTDA